MSANKRGSLFLVGEVQDIFSESINWVGGIHIESLPSLSCAWAVWAHLPREIVNFVQCLLQIVKCRLVGLGSTSRASDYMCIS